MIAHQSKGHLVTVHPASCFSLPLTCISYENVNAIISLIPAYMKPEQVSNVAISREQYNVSHYYDEVNRTKYTAERKRQLSALLGSADTRSTTISYNSSNGSKGSDAPSFSVDMTGTSGTDSENLSSAPSVSRLIGASGSVKDIDRSECPSNVVEGKLSSCSNITSSHHEGVNGRAACVEQDADAEINYVHTIRNPLGKPCTQYSYIEDDPSNDPSLLSNFTLKESHLTSEPVLSSESFCGPRSRDDTMPSGSTSTSKIKHPVRQSNVNSTDNLVKQDSGNESNCESDSLIDKRLPPTCSAMKPSDSDNENDNGDDEPVTCTSKLL